MAEIRHHRRIKRLPSERDKLILSEKHSCRSVLKENLSHPKSSQQLAHNPRPSSESATVGTSTLDNSTNCNVENDIDIPRNENTLFFPEIINRVKSESISNPGISSPQYGLCNFKFHSNVGLKNLGNTCFMNSAIQCLVHLEPLVLYFLKGLYRSDLNLESPYKGCLASSFADLLSEMCSTSNSSVTPINFKKIVTKFAPHLLDYEQQDCQEFLRFLLDGLSEDLKRLQNAASDLNQENYTPTTTSGRRPTPPISTLSQRRLSARTIERIRQLNSSQEVNLVCQTPQPTSSEISFQDNRAFEATGLDEVESKSIGVDDMATLRTLLQKSRLRKGEPPQITDADLTNSLINESEKAWKQYHQRNNSIITDIFGGQLQSSIECSTCHYKSSCFDPFLDLSLPLAASSSKCTLENCLLSYSAPEILDEDNAYFCERCKRKQKCVKRLVIAKCPLVLVIHIKRFRYTSIRREKMFTEVEFPVSNLDMSPYVIPELAHKETSSYQYDLAAVAHHNGTLHGGHYIAHADTTEGVPSLSDKRPQNWMCFNDSRVTPASTSTIGGPSAYILFYRRHRSTS